MAWPDTIFRWLGFSRYQAQPAAVVPGNVAELQGDAHGRLRVAAQAEEPTARVTSTALENSRLVSATPCKLLELYGFNDDTVKKYLMIFDRASPPVGAETDFLEVLLLPPGTPFGFSPGVALPCVHGLAWAVSTTPDALTQDVASKTHVTVAIQ